jgi:hypothetical protein
MTQALCAFSEELGHVFSLSGGIVHFLDAFPQRILKYFLCSG